MQNYPVSVIIPTYNREKFLSESIQSVLSQSCLPAEIIIIDDGSTDATRECVLSFVESSPVSLSYVYQENRGPAAARNLGIMNATHDHIAFLDSDDLWHPNKLQKQYGLMLQNPHFKISHTREKWLRRGEHLNQKKKHLPRHGDIYKHCLKLCAVGMSTVMMKKELFSEVGLLDETFLCCEDYELWLRVAARYPFLLVDEPMTIKQGGREDQLSFLYRIGMDRYRIKALEKLLTEVPLTGEQRVAAQKELMKKLTIYGNGCLRHDKAEEGQRCLDRAKELQQVTTVRQR
ncbi:glycosyltransferase family 2 protein [Desulfopila aestuarii]|uniref:Glycosyl transferase family 2 n=1 Tax=Desulfopila aestuarii DSM 18488 TaxID=1121416 RepID=A0A1M7Y3U9_9BACT|nr:glycosyltransferase family A protein [Desulfopila aestuarii]SHO46899.1 Glycosyl transferase family 2 [Desulfopila aestuarii DSM 18488]